MNRTGFRVVIDILMYVVTCLLTGTGLLIHYRLVPGFRGGHGLSMMGLTRHEWGTWHLWSAYALIGLVAVHLVVNFKFVICMIAAGKAWVGTAIAMLGVVVVTFFLLFPMERDEDLRDGGGGRRNSGMPDIGRHGH